MDWITNQTREFMSRGYLVNGQTVEQRIHEIALRAESFLFEGFAERFEANMAKGWYSLSTPIWANFGKSRGLPISCFSSYMTDSMDSILETHAEVGMMTKYGGGTSAYFGELRPRGAPIRDNGESSGAVHFMQLFDKLIGVVSQGATRRGSFAAYLPIDHGDIHEFLTIKQEGHPIQDISFGVTVRDAWMQQMIDGDYEKRALWAKVLESRTNTGYPYIIFTDNANKGAPDVYRDHGMHIKSSNLCSEIMLYSDEYESFVCDLSSMNLLHYDEWKDTDAVELLIFFLDAVMSEFIEKVAAIPFMERPLRFAKRHRALGLGVLGYHSYLQSSGLPFEGIPTQMRGMEMLRTIQQHAMDASIDLARRFGEPLYLEGYGRRNVTTMAIAPTKSSSFILGQVSEGIEPQHTNYYVRSTAKGKYTVRNPYLTRTLKEYGKDTESVWSSIAQYSGSVQHLDFLSDVDRAIFKTFSEITPKEIIVQAAQRQRFIDQGQSLNLMIHSSIPVKDINTLLIDAWQLGVKSLYYQIGVNAAQQFSRNILHCVSCE